MVLSDSKMRAAPPRAIRAAVPLAWVRVALEASPRAQRARAARPTRPLVLWPKVPMFPELKCCAAFVLAQSVERRERRQAGRLEPGMTDWWITPMSQIVVVAR